MRIYCLILLILSGVSVAFNFLKTGFIAFDDSNVRFRAPSRVVSNSKSMFRCPYVYPEWAHAHLFLSNIMNELAKIFVRVSDYVEEIKKAEERVRHKKRMMRAHATIRFPVARFKVVSTKNVSFFDHIFSDMIDSFNKFSREKIPLRSRADPCQHQRQIKRIWAELLDQSIYQLRSASVRCVKIYMKAENQPLDAKAKNKLGRYLLNEFKKLRAYQVDSLCYKHNLCYQELLLP